MREVKVEQEVPGLGRIWLAAYCVKIGERIARNPERITSRNCIVVIVSKEFIEKNIVTTYDILSSILLAYRLHAKGEGVAKKPYIEALVLLARKRNVAEVLAENTITPGTEAVVAAACTNPKDIEEVKKKLTSLEVCELPPMEPLSTDEIAVFAVDSKAFRKMVRG